jgi:hypothetical protein
MLTRTVARVDKDIGVAFLKLTCWRNQPKRDESDAGTRQATAVPPSPEKCHLTEVINYGRNLICHDRFENNGVGSGNNMMGLSRLQAMNSKICVAGK